MRYTFTPTLEAFEDAVVAALKADPEISAYVMAVEPFQGDLETALQDRAARDPSMLVLYTGGAMEPRGSTERVHISTWQVLVQSQNLRAINAQKNPTATGEVGAYRLARDAAGTLERQQLAGAGPITVHQVDLLETGNTRDRRRSAYVVTFSAELDFVPDEGTDLETVSVSYTTPTGKTLGGDNVEVSS